MGEVPRENICSNWEANSQLSDHNLVHYPELPGHNSVKKNIM
jgi:hypothetical protein